MKPVSMIVVAIAASSAIASAQPSGAQAEILFRQGKELAAKGDVAGACEAFDASEKLDPTTSTVLNQASCREKNEQLATAWGLYLEAERETRTLTDALGKQMHETAVTRAAKLEPRLSTLTITVSDDAKIAGLEIIRDKDVVEVGAWNKTLPIDGGTYRIIAHAPGNSEWSTTVTVGTERDAKTVVVPRLKAPDLPPTTKSDDAAAKPIASPPQARKWLPFAVGGGGVALLGTALAFELAGESTYGQAKSELDPARQISLWHTAEHDRITAEAMAVGGVAAAGIAVWLYIRDRRAERSLALAPMAVGGRAGIQLVGGF